ncbi:MAG: methenyltetrahydromethanopterin cyclohydrolase [Planctomycetia bacterium]|nr:methenyltetrahydromethanopterin cyclohydrolase [Planctomycetia bacterium]
MPLNAAALRIVAELLARPDAHGIACHTVAGAQVVDCGLDAPGSVEAGVLLARVAMAGLGSVRIEPSGHAPEGFARAWPDCEWPLVTVESDTPVAACLASQYAGWKVTAPGYFAMASGPIRAAIGREDLYAEIGMRERPEAVVGLLEASSLPPAEVIRTLAAAADVAPERMVLLVARTASTAGTLQVIARSLETALHKLHDLRFDLVRVRRGAGRAPLAPVPGRNDLLAIGRTNDAILYGGHVVLELTGDDASLLEIGPRMVSRASAEHGVPFRTLFERAGRDFYALDPALFAPALVDLVNVDTGRTHRFGGISPDVVHASFTTPAAAASGCGT